MYKSAGDDHFDVVVMGKLPCKCSHSPNTSLTKFPPTTDISMPIMDGLSATREIRRFERDNNIDGASKRTHVVALTGVASESARQDAFGAGVDIFLTKPAPLKRLMGIVEEFMEKKDAAAGR